MARNNSVIGAQERLSILIGKIYDASLNPAAWQPVVEDIVAMLAGSAGQFFTPMHTPDSGGFSFSVNIPDTFIQQYVAKYHKDDLWTQACFSKGLTASGTVVTDEDLVPRRNLLASRYYREFLKPSDTSRACISVIFGAEAPDMRVTSMVAYRQLRARPFSATAKEWMRLLNPHISRALGITYRLQDASFAIATTQAALDRIQSGIVLLDVRRSVTFANRAATTLFDGKSVLSLRRGTDGRDRIIGQNAAITAEIDRLIAGALRYDAVEVDHFVKSLPIPRPHGAPPLLLNVSALPFSKSFDSGSARSGAILFITDTEQPLAVADAAMVKLFGLTEAEIALVRLLCAGLTLAEAATKRGLSIETVRSQLKSVFTKTQTRRQADLVRLMLGLSSTR